VVEAPAIEIPEFVFPEGTEVEDIPAFEPSVNQAPEPVSEPTEVPEAISEIPAVPKRNEETAELLRLMSEESTESWKPAPKPIPKEEPKKAPPVKDPTPAPQPVTPKSLVSKPVDAIPLPQPSSKRPGLLAKFKAAWSPTPKKTIKPPLKVKPAAMPAPASVPVQPEAKPTVLPPVVAKPAVLPKPAAKPKPEGKGFISKLFSPKKPLKKPVIPSTLTASSPVTTPTPEPVKKAVPAAKAPLPLSKKPVPAPKPKKEKVPSLIDPLAVWPPWILAMIAIICSAFRDFGFEPLPAVLWGLAGWAVGFMVRLARLYPFQSFEETDLTALAGRKGSALPVILKGRIVPADDEKPKGEVVFKQEEKVLRLNPIKPLDVIPRLFGLSNPRQLLLGDVTLRGWYRQGVVPALEVQDVRTEKTSRKSMVKSLRWAAAIALLLLAVIVSLALE
jgi:hypothetical protein